MPGLTGLSLTGGAEVGAGLGIGAGLEVMAKALFRAPGLGVRHFCTAGQDTAKQMQCLLVGRSKMTGIALRPGSGLAVEGYVLDTEKTGDALAEWLLGRFLERGEKFAASLRGSFQIVIQYRGASFLYVDPVASRRLFYAPFGDGLLFSPEIEPLMALLGRDRIDPPNIVQFLMTGRFFAGETPLATVRQLLPGEYLVHRRGGSRRRHYFHYETQPESGRFDPREALAEFETRLERAIMDSWARARQPIFLLSGGYDSRFILCTVARAMGDSALLRTVSWGEDPGRPESDTWVSDRISRHFDTRHLLWDWGVEQIPLFFDTMFRAQSGMTDFAFSHVGEFLHCRTLHREHGIESIFRGDEIFGPQKPEVHDVDQALERMALLRRCPPTGRGWFTRGHEEYPRAHAERFDRLLEEAPERSADLRDTLYARERLPTFQQQLNYYRSHEVEMFNPLVDADILRFYREVPASYRLDKRFFKMAFEHQFGAHLKEIPIAAHGNAIDWTRVLRRCPPVVDFLRRGLEALPSPLNPAHFLGLLEDVLGETRRGEAGSIAPHRLLMRAFVLGRWLDLWGR